MIVLCLVSFCDIVFVDTHKVCESFVLQPFCDKVFIVADKVCDSFVFWPGFVIKVFVIAHKVLMVCVCLFS